MTIENKLMNLNKSFYRQHICRQYNLNEQEKEINKPKFDFPRKIKNPRVYIMSRIRIYRRIFRRAEFHPKDVNRARV